MKAIVCSKYGGPDVLKLKEVSMPSPKDDEVLIKVYATAVTASDVLLRGLNAPFIYRFFIQLMMGFKKPRNPILGMVMSGVVEKTGKKVNLFKVGDPVFASGSKSAIKLKFGAYAEYICLPEDWNISVKPQNLSFQKSAAIPYGAGIAWFYFKKMDIKAHHKVLIYGASGSVGLMALQLIKHAGAEITAVCSSKNFELVKSLGADKTIDYSIPNASSQLEQYDLVFDAVGDAKTSELKIQSKKALTLSGKYISVDQSAPSTSKDDFAEITRFFEQGKLKATIDRVYPLDQMVQAHEYVEKGHKVGSVVVSVYEEEI